MDTAYVLITDFYKSTNGAEVIGVYKTKESVQKDFKEILIYIWPEDNNYVDDNGNDFDECVNELMYSNEKYLDFMYAEIYDVKE